MEWKEQTHRHECFVYNIDKRVKSHEDFFFHFLCIQSKFYFILQLNEFGLNYD